MRKEMSDAFRFFRCVPTGEVLEFLPYTAKIVTSDYPQGKSEQRYQRGPHHRLIPQADGTYLDDQGRAWEPVD